MTSTSISATTPSRSKASGAQEHEEHSRGYYHSELLLTAASTAASRSPRALGPTRPMRTSAEGVLEVTMPAPKGEVSHGRRVEVKG